MARILLIDDDEMLRETAEFALRRAGHEVLTAETGVGAAGIVDRAKVDLVITDILMPEKEGIETIRDLRRGGHKVPILAISGDTRGDVGGYLGVAKRLGATETLAKPFSASQLVAAAQRCLQAAVAPASPAS